MTLVLSWSAVPPHVSVNCYSKTGISDSSRQVALTDEDDSYKELIEDLDELREAHPHAVSEGWFRNVKPSSLAGETNAHIKKIKQSVETCNKPHM